MSGRSRIALILSLAAVVLLGSLPLVSCTKEAAIDGLFGKEGEFSSDISADNPSRANPGKPLDTTPRVLQATQPGDAVKEHEKATLDYSNAASGYVCVRNNVEQTKVMVVVSAPDGNQYKYSTVEAGSYITIPLSVGNGTYQVDVYENLYGDNYAAVFAQKIDVVLDDEFGPFLYPNPCVNYAEGDQVVKLSQQLATNATSEVEVVDQIYMYVVQNIRYDYEKAETVAPGYLPSNQDTLTSKTGICFDYASLIASMLRAQGLPTKLNVGYCGAAYHAWVEVYTKEAGWIRKKIEFPGNAYVRLDPTFDAASKGTGDVSKLVGDGKSYQPIFYY